MKKLLGGMVFGASVLLTGSAGAEPNACAVIGRENIAPCAVRASAVVRFEQEGTSAARGRRVAAAPWFPSNPTLSLSAAERSRSDAQTVNYAATLTQEIEIAGQRGARRRAADADVDSHTQEAAAAARRAAADGYVAYFDYLAARDALVLARRLEATSRLIADVTRARATAGVASPLEAEIADAASLRVTQARLEAEREQRMRSARLAALLGGDPSRDTIAVSGALEPLHGVETLASSATTDSAARRPELRALANEQRAHEARADAFRRARIPALTLQVFAQNDGFDERVLGAGVSVPIPLPQPVGHFQTGEIREAEALARQTAARSDALTRAINADLAIARATWESRRDEAALFTQERVDRSERLLSEIGKEIEAGRLPVRDALVAQQELIGILRGFVDARRALCLASVDLAWAAGVDLEGAGR